MRVTVVNPNSTQAVTDGIRGAMRAVDGGDRVGLDYVTLAGAPAIWDINFNEQDCNALYLY